MVSATGVFVDSDCWCWEVMAVGGFASAGWAGFVHDSKMAFEAGEPVAVERLDAICLVRLGSW